MSANMCSLLHIIASLSFRANVWWNDDIFRVHMDDHQNMGVGHLFMMAQQCDGIMEYLHYFIIILSLFFLFSVVLFYLLFWN